MVEETRTQIFTDFMGKDSLKKARLGTFRSSFALSCMRALAAGLWTLVMSHWVLDWAYGRLGWIKPD